MCIKEATLCICSFVLLFHIESCSVTATCLPEWIILSVKSWVELILNQPVDIVYSLLKIWFPSLLCFLSTAIILVTEILLLSSIIVEIDFKRGYKMNHFHSLCLRLKQNLLSGKRCDSCLFSSEIAFLYTLIARH